MINRVNNKVTMAIQKNFSFVAFFIPFYLVIPNNLLTHTHTHTHTHLNNSSYARVRYTIKSYKQRVCKKFFDNFLHAFFVRINE